MSDSTTLNSLRLPAFVVQPHDEDPVLDGLGFLAWGAYEGEWSGTSVWLADAPLPAAVENLKRPLPELPPIVAEARAAVAAGDVEPVRFLAPIENEAGAAVLPIEGAGYDVDPNYVAHIVRTLTPDGTGGRWVLAHRNAKMSLNGNPRPAPSLIYVVNGQARAVVAPSLATTPASRRSGSREDGRHGR